MPEHAHTHPGHAHAHPHHYPHDAAGAPRFGAAFGIAIGLNLAFVVAGVVFGILSNSMALIADAGHNLGDVLGLVVAWIASLLALLAPSRRYTYGLRSSSILAALFNAVLLLVVTGAIAFEAINRFYDPAPVAGITMMVVAGIGVAINGISALLFMGGRKHDLNIRGAFLHLLSDALVSVGVVVAGLAIYLTGHAWIDPVVSLIISAAIVYGTWGLLRDAVNMTLHGVPAGIDPEAVMNFLRATPGVADVHDLHIWPMSTTETALTCHLVMPAGFPGDEALRRVSDDLRAKFGIPHATIQVEISDPTTDCAVTPGRAV
jgi:cobalt-zinc-cadmium efflux system protein